MLKSIKIENFRCFRAFELQQLGRVNLLVGTNNSGKTSILEAIQLLTSPPSFEILRGILLGRGEYSLNRKADPFDRDQNLEFEVRHLFYEHEIREDSSFLIFSRSGPKRVDVLVELKETSEIDPISKRPIKVPILTIRQLRKPSVSVILTPRLSLSLNVLEQFNKSAILPTSDSKISTQFIASSSLTTEEMIEVFNKLVLTPEEDLIVEALQIIEPNIQRIAVVGTKGQRLPNSRSGFAVRLAGNTNPIPIGSMGDGIWRLLGLVLALVNSRDGVLLVDEIDTGLHFSVMSDMWRLIWETAKRLNVQVFATTHNSDCWTSLAAIANTEHPSEEGITIHRIEKDKASSVVFTERQVAIAAERGIEVR